MELENSSSVKCSTTYTQWFRWNIQPGGYDMQYRQTIEAMQEGRFYK